MWCGQAGRLGGPADEQRRALLQRKQWVIFMKWVMRSEGESNNRRKCGIYYLLPFAFLSLLTRSLALAKVNEQRRWLQQLVEVEEWYPYRVSFPQSLGLNGR